MLSVRLNGRRDGDLGGMGGFSPTLPLWHVGVWGLMDGDVEG